VNHPEKDSRLTIATIRVHPRRRQPKSCHQKGIAMTMNIHLAQQS